MADNYEKVEFPAEQPEEDQEHNQKMMDLVDKANEVESGLGVQDNVEVPPKPEGIPDKFYNAETGKVDYDALAKSYVELEKRQGKPAEQEETTAETEEPKTAEEAVEKAGLDMSQLQSEYDSNGQLTDKSYDALAEAGIPRETVDMYIAGQRALQAQAQADAYSITEGKEGYNAMSDWARSNLSADELQNYNTQVNSPNKETRDIAVRGLWAKFAADSGGGRELVHGKNSDSTVGGYKSRQQMIEAMKDPRYINDPAYRAEVESKVASSTF